MCTARCWGRMRRDDTGVRACVCVWIQPRTLLHQGVHPRRASQGDFFMSDDRLCGVWREAMAMDTTQDTSSSREICLTTNEPNSKKAQFGTDGVDTTQDTSTSRVNTGKMRGRRGIWIQPEDTSTSAGYTPEKFAKNKCEDESGGLLIQ